MLGPRYKQVDKGNHTVWVEASDGDHADVDCGGYTEFRHVGKPEKIEDDDMLPNLESSLYDEEK